MAKKHHNWQQTHIANLKRHNTTLQECCKDWAKQDLAQMRHIQRLGGEVTALRKKVAALEKDLSAAREADTALRCELFYQIHKERFES